MVSEAARRGSVRVGAVFSVVMLLFGLILSASTPRAHAVEVPQTLGDPIYGDEPQFEDNLSDATRAAGDLKDLKTWSPPATTNATTSAYIDVNGDRVYQASRSEKPALFFANKLSDSSTVNNFTIGNTTGSWDMALNGSLLAIGTNGDGTTRPRVVVRNTTNGSIVADSALPAATSASAYVMSIVADPKNPKAFWVGTYEQQGARLYHFNYSANAKFVDYTPGKSWSSAGLKYVRSLSAGPKSLSIGMGNPGSVWILKYGDKAPTKASGALAPPASMVYSLASTPSVNQVETTFSEELPTEGELLEDSSQPALEEPQGPEQTTQSETEPEQTATEETPEQTATEEIAQSETQSEDATATEPITQAREPSEPALIEEEHGLEDDQPAPPVDSESSIQDKAIKDSLFIAGTEAPASVNVFNSDGSRVSSYTFPATEGKTIDRITIDENRVAWFTLRPSGDLYSMKIDDTNLNPEHISSTLPVSETRAISANNGIVSGVTGTRQLWKYDTNEGKLETSGLERSVPEKLEISTQGVIAAPNATLVGGHWRYQVRDSAGKSTVINIPGEPKVQILVGDTVYSAVYPSASLLRIDLKNNVAESVVQAKDEQFRPRALTYNNRTKTIYMATSSAYGKYGGGITSYDPETGKSEYFKTPVDKQAPFSLDSIGNGLVVGMSTAGEAVAAPANAKTAIVRWEKGKVVWKRTLNTNSSVAGVATISDRRGDFIFATTQNNMAYALDGSTGAIIWQERLPGAGNKIMSVDNYTLVLSGNDLIEYFPTRSALTKGKTLSQGVRWADLQKRSNGALEVATVTSSQAARGSILRPREMYRTQGNNRYLTAIAASQQEFSSSPNVVLATGTDFPDALCAGPLAVQLNAPLLLNDKGTLRPEVANELTRLKAKKVYIVGGSGVISGNVQSALTRKGISVERLGGNDRFDTSIKVANKIRSLAGKSKIPVIATTGMVFPDALSATPAAASVKGAIVLTKESTLNPQIKNYLKSTSVSDVATVGGLAEKAVRSAGIKPAWTASGRDRYDTSAKVAAKIAGNAKTVFVATGADYPDGLAGGPAAAREGAPVVLTRTNALSPQAVNSLRSATKVTALGGVGVMPPALLNQIRSL